MLLIDVPVGLIAGQVIADAGKNMIKSGDTDKYLYLSKMTIAFAYCFIMPIVIYFYVGWPAWETNYLFARVDFVQNTPWMALLSGISVVALTIIPAVLGLKSGKHLIRKGKVKTLRVIYAGLGVVILVIVYLTREATFNIAATHTDYRAGNTFSFFDNPFFIYWLVLTVLFYGVLLAFFLWIRRKDREVR